MRLKDIYAGCMEENRIDSSLYPRFRVKAGLRNENGTGVKVGLTKICDVVGYQMIHGHKHNVDGKLIYRGYDVEGLVEDCKDRTDGFEETAFLLIFGRRPTPEELSQFEKYLKENIHTDFISAAYPTKSLLNAMQIEVLKLYGQDPNPDNDLLEERMEKGLAILASLPLFVFSNYTNWRIAKYPDENASIAENILLMARQNGSYTRKEAQVLDTLLMVHADHGGGNNSTFANVVITSTGTDIYSCMSAAIGSLKGPKHGGAAKMASEQFSQMKEVLGITSDEKKIEDYLYKVLAREAGDKSGLIYGMGHAIYTKSDPRARIIKRAAKELAEEKGRSDEYEMLVAIENMARKVLHTAKGNEVCANVDFYSGFAYSMLGIQEELYTSLFAVARMSGWIAHHLENRQSNRKLIRPANIYVGDHK